MPKSQVLLTRALSRGLMVRVVNGKSVDGFESMHLTGSLKELAQPKHTLDGVCTWLVLVDQKYTHGQHKHYYDLCWMQH